MTTAGPGGPVDDRRTRHPRRRDVLGEFDGSLTRGQRAADAFAATVGSWRFILIQTVVLLLWLGMNTVRGDRAWDPYPFILLNLVLSFQAAYAAPILMMSQNRAASLDRMQAAADYAINRRAETEIAEMLLLLRAIATHHDLVPAVPEGDDDGSSA